jgi:hypothetical protein
MMESCSKMEAGDWKEARKETWRLRMRVASLTNRLGKPSAKVLLRERVARVWVRPRGRGCERGRPRGPPAPAPLPHCYLAHPLFTST